LTFKADFHGIGYVPAANELKRLRDGTIEDSTKQPASKRIKMSEMSYTGQEEDEDDDGFSMTAVYDHSSINDKSRYLKTIGGEEESSAKDTKHALADQNLQFVFGETLSITPLTKQEDLKLPQGYNPFKVQPSQNLPILSTKKKTMAEEILAE